LKTIKSDVEKIRTEQKEMIKSIEHCFELINDNKKIISKHESEINSCANDIVSVSNRITTLQSELNKVNRELSTLQQYTRKNCINIVGVPFEKNENITETIKKISASINFDFNSNMIDNCHRLSNKTNQNFPPQIVVKFCRNIDKEKFLQCKTKKGKLLAGDLGWENNNNIVYINESMSPFNRVLFLKGKELQKQNLLKYVWFRNGNVFVRRNEHSKRMLVTTAQDYDTIISSRATEDTIEV
jgi:hypothetical protein